MEHEFVFVSCKSFFTLKYLRLGQAAELSPTLGAYNPSLKLTKASLVFIDPPYGYNVADWDSPSDVWTPEYFSEIFKSLTHRLLPSATIVVFGDIFTVLPNLVGGVELFNNNYASGQDLFVAPVHFVYHKTNKPHKGASGYSHSLENAFVYFYQRGPPIVKQQQEIGGNLLTGPRVAGIQRIVNLDDEMLNVSQKPHRFLSFFLDNHAQSETLVLDLTAGSFSSYLACFFNKKVLHWAGCDVKENGSTEFETFRNETLTSPFVDSFEAGTTHYSFFNINLAVALEKEKSRILTSVTTCFQEQFGKQLLFLFSTFLRQTYCR